MAEESDLQRQIIRYLQDNLIYYKRMHTQGVRQSKGYVKNPNKGMADILVVLDGQVVWVELKSKKGKQSEEQLSFEKEAVENGCIYLLINDLDQFVRALTCYMLSNELNLKTGTI